MEIMYGYLRVNATSDAAQRVVEQRMRGFAAAGGFDLVKIYFEHDPIIRSAFYRMFDDLQRFNVHHLVVPSMDHFADHERLCDLRLAQLADTAAVQVHELDEPASRNGGESQVTGSRQVRPGR